MTNEQVATVVTALTAITEQLQLIQTQLHRLVQAQKAKK